MERQSWTPKQVNTTNNHSVIALTQKLSCEMTDIFETKLKIQSHQITALTSPNSMESSLPLLLFRKILYIKK